MLKTFRLRDIFLRTISFINTTPFRFLCGRMDQSSVIGPGYSFLGCHLENVQIEKNVSIGSRAWIQSRPLVNKPLPKLVIGSGTNIGRGTVISAAEKISIGRNCLFSYNVSVLDHHHRFEDLQQSPLFQGVSDPKPVKIGDNCFLGAHSFILEGVTLGEHCVVGANSVVTKSFPSFSVVVGVPARRVQTLK